jgi:hypothetical protein
MNSALPDRDALAVQAAHPAWQIGQDLETGAWGALIRLSSTGIRYLVGPALDALAAKLDAEGSEAGH